MVGAVAFGLGKSRPEFNRKIGWKLFTTKCLTINQPYLYFFFMNWTVTEYLCHLKSILRGINHRAATGNLTNTNNIEWFLLHDTLNNIKQNIPIHSISNKYKRKRVYRTAPFCADIVSSCGNYCTLVSQSFQEQIKHPFLELKPLFKFNTYICIIYPYINAIFQQISIIDEPGNQMNQLSSCFMLWQIHLASLPSDRFLSVLVCDGQSQPFIYLIQGWFYAMTNREAPVVRTSTLSPHVSLIWLVAGQSNSNQV